MSLPTFPELMASLQLTSKGEPGAVVEDPVQVSSAPPSPSPYSPSFSPTATCQHPPSTSVHDSPSIVVSQFEATRLPHPAVYRSLGRSSRFAPYFGATSATQPRRSSVDATSADLHDDEAPETASSASPKSRPTSQEVNPSAPRLHKVGIGDIESESDVPISSFARRRTPQSSPTASAFPHRRRSSSQTSFSPVMLPSLPPGLTSPSSPHTPDDMDVSEMEDHIPQQPQNLPKTRVRRQGLRLSSYRENVQPYGQVNVPSVHSAA